MTIPNKASAEQIALLRTIDADDLDYRCAAALTVVLDDHARMSEELERYRWCPIKSAPKDGTDVVGLLSDGAITKMVWLRGDGWIDNDGDDVGPTHWMPLFASPQTEEKEKHAP